MSSARKHKVPPGRSWTERASVILLAILFISAGVFHFLKTSFYVTIVPPWLPHAAALVYISGICEVLGGTGLLIPRTRRYSGLLLIALLLAVFPANIHMALNSQTFAKIPAIILWLRLPLQFVLIAWVWWSTRRHAQK